RRACPQPIHGRRAGEEAARRREQPAGGDVVPRGELSGAATGRDDRALLTPRSWRLIPVVHPLTSVFALALLVRLINIALLAHRDAFFAEQDAYGYWSIGA